MKLYGIANCSTVKKARAWLVDKNIPMEFHDFKKLGVNELLLKTWIYQVGWERLINRKGTTWRQLPDTVKASISDESAAIHLMQEKPSIIKRPIAERDGKIVHLGFDESSYNTLFRK
ncbi:MAG: ArsC family reductase [Sulfuricella sp.]|nr:ArsC family reductase [Sulfuricella sp.]